MLYLIKDIDPSRDLCGKNRDHLSCLPRTILFDTSTEEMGNELISSWILSVMARSCQNYIYIYIYIERERDRER